MNALTDTYTLANGVTIPKLGFGTWQIEEGEQAYSSVATALEVGYRHIDTARAYGNEASVGRAIRASGIPRDKIFVTTKLPAEIKDAEGARFAFEQSLQLLDLGYIDLYIIHAPWPWDQRGSDWRTGNVEVYKTMEENYAAGRARAIGVSNFSVDDLDSLTQSTEIVPMANQIRYFVGFTQDDVSTYSAANDILIEAYSPLATGLLLEDESLTSLAASYDRSLAQLAIRYALQKGTVPLPKTTTASRIAENADIDFEISESDMQTMDAMSDPRL